MKKAIIILFLVFLAGCTTQEVILGANICTQEQKAAEVCTMDYSPICGDDSVTYGNICMGCASGNITSWTDGECEITYVDISASDAYDLINSQDVIIIDVSPSYDNGHLPDAINYYFGDGSLDAAIPSLDPNAVYLVYCHVDSVAISGAQALIDAGFLHVYRLEGNYAAWVEVGYPVE